MVYIIYRRGGGAISYSTSSSIVICIRIDRRYSNFTLLFNYIERKTDALWHSKDTVVILAPILKLIMHIVVQNAALLIVAL